MTKYIRFSKQSMLTDSDILDMRMAYNSGNASVEDIADLYGINKTTAARIIDGTSWAHVPSPKSIAKGKYAVYPDGRIFSTSNRSFMSTRINKEGEAVVELRANGKREITPVAYLVAKAFISPSIRSSRSVSFIDGQTDYHFTNLSVTNKTSK